MSTKTELHWVALAYDETNLIEKLILGQTYSADIGHDDALWIEPMGDEWALSHNTREISRHARFQDAKDAAAEYFSTL
ncbi:hypothetical protein FZI85_17345 [Mycobacterium sp. CBMA293]|uniref:hypothetical protein n=1 Tax=unclassified Mycolicibacterium TaxID=2636767 RepID=UPI0012DF7234|nr:MULTISPECIES: hypothetical protein [unclassified Mycolicibacterium]MUL44488.1 hypothetical protein [Mycolicibacterium sp. CBMA 360]MUL59808.1 hypothetical protein [Mycolicibacterium sp. CBMA 335]MUL68651.1 hypothetical protein [Mycolicibacterium sp. CBMA 311]MUL93958.1 hypothetical protein [Mycolicibacterium sp. CBMA 230]MUM06204.1 hypothetical protein [Mycolicibacterium sp. CBMA 213]